MHLANATCHASVLHFTFVIINVELEIVLFANNKNNFCI